MKYINNAKKIEKIQFNKENYCVVTDFDRTITTNVSMDSWDASGMTLGQEFKNELSELYHKYRPIEQSYTMPIEEKEKAMVEWYSKCMNLYFEYGLTQEKLEKSIENSNMIFREGAKEFLQESHKNNIPVIILSAGIGNVIKQFLKTNNCYFENMCIISNFIEFDENGNMKKFDNKKIIHTLNKRMEGHTPKEFEEKAKNRKYKLLFGDLIEDLKMVKPEEIENTVTVGLLENLDENLEIYNKNFDIVLTRKRC
jgi:5'-nucleotidase